MPSYKRTKWACYMTNISMSVVTNLGPILFLSFKELYGISYSEIGLLILLTFSVQLGVDLIFSFFPHRFNIPLTVRLTPIITVIGLVVFALAPLFFPGTVFIGLVLGVVIYSASAGLVEVLISPVIAAIPADNPDAEMSKLHSIYAWGVVGVVPVSTLFIFFFGADMWQLLALAFALVPLSAAMLFMGADMPPFAVQEKEKGAASPLRSPALWLSVAAIFLGGAAECTMAQWASTYLEAALGIEKLWGDLFGVTLFAAMLGLGRTLYSKFGKCPEGVLLVGGIGAFVCYLLASLSPFPLLGLVGCALCGLCVSMLWPGSLIVGADRVPQGGVILYAMMAAGGDLGASAAPQLVGIVTDAVVASGIVSLFPALSAEELGMRIGLLVGALFPLIAIAIYTRLYKTRKNK